MSEYREEPRTPGEGWKFIALIILLLLAVGCVAVTRPFVFGQIVPAVIGEDIVLPDDDPTTVEEQPAEEAENTADEAGDEAAEEEEGETADSNTTTSEGTPAEETTDPTNDTESGEAASEDAGQSGAQETTTHTIKQGETLQTIAAQYGITLPELIAANKLANPDYIRVGDKLVIPPKK